MKSGPQLSVSLILSEQKHKLDLRLDGIAKQLKCTKAFVYMLVHGKRNVPLELFKPVCKAFKVPERDLFGAIVKDFESNLKTSLRL